MKEKKSDITRVIWEKEDDIRINNAADSFCTAIMHLQKREKIENALPYIERGYSIKFFERIIQKCKDELDFWSQDETSEEGKKEEIERLNLVIDICQDRIDRFYGNERDLMENESKDNTALAERYVIFAQNGEQFKCDLESILENGNKRVLKCLKRLKNGNANDGIEKTKTVLGFDRNIKLFEVKEYNFRIYYISLGYNFYYVIYSGEKKRNAIDIKISEKIKSRIKGNREECQKIIEMLKNPEQRELIRQECQNNFEQIERFILNSEREEK